MSQGTECDKWKKRWHSRALSDVPGTTSRGMKPLYPIVVPELTTASSAYCSQGGTPRCNIGHRRRPCQFCQCSK